MKSDLLLIEERVDLTVEGKLLQKPLQSIVVSLLPIAKKELPCVSKWKGDFVFDEL